MLQIYVVAERRTFMRIWLFFFVFFGFFTATAQNRLLEHPPALDLVKQGLFFIYNTEAGKADQFIEEIERMMPQHPVGPMMRALNTNWSSNPLNTESQEFKILNGHLTQALDRTKQLLKEDPKHMEAVFFAMAINSWLAQFYDEEGSTLKALSAAKKAYHFMKIGFEMLDQSPEFYFSTGLYNYYRVQYPEANPIYKPFMWFFRTGDKALGLKQLEHASKTATFTKAEAAMYLAHLHLRYEQNPQLAVKFSRSLVSQYPSNTFFKINYTEALLAAEEYPKTFTIIQSLIQESKPFYRMSGEIFYGIYLERSSKDYEKALKWYHQALETSAGLGRRADNKKSLAHAGIARISASKGQLDLAKKHYRQAQKLAQYDTVKDEAKAYLRGN